MNWYDVLKLFILLGSLSVVNCVFLLTCVRLSINHYLITRDIDYMSQLLGGIDLGEKRGTQENETRH